MKKYAAADIGGTAIKYGIICENGQFLCRRQRLTQADQGGRQILAKIVEIIEELSRAETIDGICISTAGIVDTQKGEISYSAPLIPDYIGINYKTELERRFGIPCEVENDVNCAGLAEAISGAAKEYRICLMLTIGTGIGGSLIIDKEVYQGSGASACEVGYMHMNGSDFQTLGAASVLANKVSKWKQEPRETWNGYRIFEEAKKGDPLCQQAIHEMTDVLGEGIANICYVMNPEIVVLGGGIMAQKEYLKDALEASLRKYLIPYIAAQTHLAFAEYGNDAGMLGAFYHFNTKQAKKQSDRPII